MNQAQLTSIVKAVLNFLAGILVTHGASKAATMVNAEDTIGVVVFIVVWVYSHFLQHNDINEATPTPLPASKGGGTLPPVSAIVLLIGLSGILMAGLVVGCAGQNKRLELGGAYNPAVTVLATNADATISTNTVAVGQADFKLYAADVSFDFAYSSLEAAFKIERDNRAFLFKISPNIKHSLDAIRPDAAKAVKAYTVARLRYIASPIPDNASGLDTAIATIQQLADSAEAVTSALQIPAAPAK